MINPVEQIGRYQLPILNIVAIEKRQFTWLGKIFLRLKLVRDGYNATLTNGHTIHFTEDEKQAYDTARGWHDAALQWWGACKSAGLRA